MPELRKFQVRVDQTCEQGFEGNAIKKGAVLAPYIKYPEKTNPAFYLIRYKSFPTFMNASMHLSICSFS